jgi:hypothetical protein
MSLVPDESLVIAKKMVCGLDFQTKPLYLINIGASDQSTVIVSTSTRIQSGGSSITFSVNPIVGDNFFSRLLYTKIVIRYTARKAYIGNFNANNLVFANAISSPRAYGLQKCISNASMKIGNSTISHQEKHIIRALEYYLDQDTKNTYMSYQPSYSCRYQEYSDWVIYGSSKNCLGSYGENENDLNHDHAAVTYYPVTDVGNGVMEQIADVEWVFPVLLSPFDYLNKYGQSANIGRIQNLTYTLNFDDLSRSWSHDSNTSELISLVGTNIQDPTLIFTYYKYPLGVAPVIPDKLFYSYELPYVVEKTTGIVTPANANFIITSDQISLGELPESVFVFVKKSDDSITYSDTDSFAVIESLSINLDTRNSLLADFDQRQLYFIARKNGFAYSYSAFCKYIGSPILLKFGEDIPVMDALQSGVGVQSQKQLQVTCKCKNTSGKAISFALYVIYIKAGVYINYSNNNSILVTGCSTAKDMLDSPFLSDLEAQNVILTKQLYGGISMSDVSKYLTKAKEYAKKASNFAKEHKIISRAADAYQYIPGVPGKSTAAAVRDIAEQFGYAAPPKKGKRKGAGLMVNDYAADIGGKRMNKNKMKTKLIKY